MWPVIFVLWQFDRRVDRLVLTLELLNEKVEFAHAPVFDVSPVF